MNSETYLPVRSDKVPYGLVSIRSYLILLIAAILVPMLALAGVLAWHYAAASRRTIEAERLDVTSNLSDLSDREIGSMAGFLSGLSNSPRLRTGEPRVVEIVGNIARERGFQVLGLYDPAGHLMFSSSADNQMKIAPADQVGVAEIVTSHSKLFVSNLQIAPSGRPGLFFLSVPVMVDGEVAFVLTGGVAPSQLQGLFAESGLREGWRAGIVDRAGILLARSTESAAYVGHSAQQPMVDAARGAKATGLFDVVSRDGIEIKNAFLRSSLTGWTVGVAVPASVVNAPFLSTALILAAIGVCFTLISLLLAIMVARRIARDVRQLGHAVVAFASGDVVPLPTETLTELRDVLRVIEATAAMGRGRTVLRR